jgi:DNA-directed RNA polymerase specialized sigma subunit
MSLKKQPQIWGKNSVEDNKAITRRIVIMLKKYFRNKTIAHIAVDLNIKHKHVDNWMYTGTGIVQVN